MTHPTHSCRSAAAVSGLPLIINMTANGVSIMSDSAANNIANLGINTPPPDGSIISVNLSDSDLHVITQCEDFLRTVDSICSDIRNYGNSDKELPTFPRSELLKILGRSKPEKKLMGSELHFYLKNKIVTKIFECEIPEPCLFLQHNNVPNPTLNYLLPLLQEGYSVLQSINAKTIHLSLNYGMWLNVAFNVFELSKGAGLVTGSWSSWLRNTVGLSESYARQLRDLSDKFSQYKKIHYLSITFTELYKKDEKYFQCYIWTKT